MSSSIAVGYSNIERVHSIEYREWCKRYNIGSRVEVRDSRATELMQQYSERYTNWIKNRD